MSGYFQRLADRALGVNLTLQPVLPSRYAPDSIGAGSGFTSEGPSDRFVIPSEVPREDQPILRPPVKPGKEPARNPESGNDSRKGNLNPHLSSSVDPIVTAFTSKNREIPFSNSEPRFRSPSREEENRIPRPQSKQNDANPMLGVESYPEQSSDIHKSKTGPSIAPFSHPVSNRVAESKFEHGVNRIDNRNENQNENQNENRKENRKENQNEIRKEKKNSDISANGPEVKQTENSHVPNRKPEIQGAIPRAEFETKSSLTSATELPPSPYKSEASRSDFGTTPSQVVVNNGGSPTVRIQIGRIEIRASSPLPQPTPSPRKANSEMRPALSMNDYLKSLDRRPNR